MYLLRHFKCFILFQFFTKEPITLNEQSLKEKSNQEK